MFSHITYNVMKSSTRHGFQSHITIIVYIHNSMLNCLTNAFFVQRHFIFSSNIYIIIMVDIFIRYFNRIRVEMLKAHSSDFLYILRTSTRKKHYHGHVVCDQNTINMIQKCSNISYFKIIHRNYFSQLANLSKILAVTT